MERIATLHFKMGESGGEEGGGRGEGERERERRWRPGFCSSAF